MRVSAIFQLAASITTAVTSGGAAWACSSNPIGSIFIAAGAGLSVRLAMLAIRSEIREAVADANNSPLFPLP